ncbi:2Fe-2S iron-sulfur cluster-binding protein [Hansschlegelia zhihuaiae]|nr:2Fe-2S iron-sulfur cluster binding domain-containing protein [Hansschlegelia zhihuaiae]
MRSQARLGRLDRAARIGLHLAEDLKGGDFENFAPAQLPATAPDDDPGLEVELAGTGEILPLRPGQSVLDVLRTCGHDVESSCEAGTCGACRTRVLEGDVDHQDFVLTDDEQRDWMMVCVSRPRKGRIKIDLDPA